jgi:hypothetical protein
MDEIIVEYRLSWSEWRRIYWGASIKKSVSAFLLYIAFVFGVSTLVFSDGSRVQVLVIAIFAVAYFASYFWIAPRRYWNSGVGVQEAKRVEIGDEGIARTSESLEERLDWDRFRGFKEAKKYFILIGRPGSGSVFLPKRGLATVEDEGALRRLILRHIPSS